MYAYMQYICTVRIFMFTYICMYVYICIFIYVCMYMKNYVCMYLYINICIRMNVKLHWFNFLDVGAFTTFETAKQHADENFQNWEESDKNDFYKKCKVFAAKVDRQHDSYEYGTNDNVEVLLRRTQVILGLFHFINIHTYIRT